MKDNAFTKKELLQMWERPREKQLAVADAKILEALAATGGDIAVSWSGGKDSTVLLWRTAHIWSAVYKNKPLTVVFADTTNENRETYKFIDYFVPWIEKDAGVKIALHTSRPLHGQTFVTVAREYGLPLISKEVSRAIRRTRKWLNQCGIKWEDVKNYTDSNMECVTALQKMGCNASLISHLTGYISARGVFSKRYKIAKKWLPLIPREDIDVSEECCDHLKKAPLRKITRDAKTTNVMLGEMACDGRQRETAYLKTGCTFYQKNTLKSKPLGAMTEQTLLWIIDFYKIPQSKYYGELISKGGEYMFTKCQRGGCSLCGFGIEFEPDRFVKLQKDEPSKVNIAFKPKSEGGLGYLEAFTFMNEHCGTNIVIPEIKQEAKE